MSHEITMNSPKKNDIESKQVFLFVENMFDCLEKTDVPVCTKSGTMVICLVDILGHFLLGFPFVSRDCCLSLLELGFETQIAIKMRITQTSHGACCADDCMATNAQSTHNDNAARAIVARSNVAARPRTAAWRRAGRTLTPPRGHAAPAAHAHAQAEQWQARSESNS